MLVPLSLNGFQVITDGVTFRTDQIPAGTLADCLAADPEYALRRGGAPPPFLDPAAVPGTDAEFAAWYRGHVRRFFGVSDPEYDRLFGLHALRFEAHGADSPAFDALACDGCSNHLLLRRKGGGWEAVAFKARGCGREAKADLAGWLTAVYAADRYPAPPPLARGSALLAYRRAEQVARRLTGEKVADGAVWFPLAAEHGTALNYRLIKASAFLYKTAAQRRGAYKAFGRFADRTGCGFELLALRRGASRGRAQFSPRDVAAAIYAAIRRGTSNLARSLNATHLVEEIRAVGDERVRAIARLRDEELARQRAEFAGVTGPARLTGWYVFAGDV